MKGSRERGRDASLRMAAPKPLEAKDNSPRELPEGAQPGKSVSRHPATRTVRGRISVDLGGGQCIHFLWLL